MPWSANVLPAILTASVILSGQIEAATGLTLMQAIRNNGFDEMMALCGGCLFLRDLSRVRRSGLH
jgi:hypothetical protein